VTGSHGVLQIFTAVSQLDAVLDANDSHLCTIQKITRTDFLTFHYTYYTELSPESWNKLQPVKEHPSLRQLVSEDPLKHMNFTPNKLHV